MQITKKLMLEYVEILKRFAASHITDEQHEKNGTVPPDVMLKDMINNCLWFREPKFKIGDEVVHGVFKCKEDRFIVYAYHIVKQEKTGQLTLLYVISQNIYTGAFPVPEELLILKRDEPYYKWDNEYGKWVDQRFYNQTGWTPTKESIVLAGTTTDEPEVKE